MGLPKLKNAEPVAERNPWLDLTPGKLGLDSFVSVRINRLARILNKPTGRPHFAALGIAVLEWRVLAYLMNLSPCSARELGARMGVDKGVISRTLRRLEQRGFVSVRQSPKDARSSIVTVRAAGEKMYRTLLPLVQKRQATLLGALTVEERRVLWHALDKLMVAANKLRQVEIQNGRTASRKKPQL